MVQTAQMVLMRDLGNGDGGEVKNVITGFKLFGFVGGGCILLVFIGIFAAEGWDYSMALNFIIVSY